MAGITREELEEKVTSEKQKRILEVLDKICPTVFITNRNRFELVEKMEELMLDAYEEGTAFGRPFN